VWPESREIPEDTEPAHGHGSSESQMFIGATTINTNTSSGQMLMVNSEPISSDDAQIAWLPTGPVFVDAGLIESFPRYAPNLDTASGIDRLGHMSNPSTIEIRRSFTRRNK